MNDILWAELMDAKKKDIYLNKYVSFHKSVKKWFSIFTVILSSTSLIAWLKDRGAYLTGLSIGLSIIAKSLELLQSHIIASDEYLNDILDVRKLWLDYFFAIEEIYIERRFELINRKEAIEKYKAQKELKKEIENKMGSLKIWIFYFMNKSADNETNFYLNKYYEQKTNNN